MPYRRPKAPKTGPGRRRVEATPVELAGSKCAARANRASVFGAMAQTMIASAPSSLARRAANATTPRCRIGAVVVSR